MTAFLVGAWFVLGILGVALDFSNPVEDGFFGPLWFAVMLAFVIFNPAPVRKKESE